MRSLIIDYLNFNQYNIDGIIVYVAFYVMNEEHLTKPFFRFIATVKKKKKSAILTYVK